jgi:hypothetical protein
MNRFATGILSALVLLVFPAVAQEQVDMAMMNRIRLERTPIGQFSRICKGCQLCHWKTQWMGRPKCTPGGLGRVWQRLATRENVFCHDGALLQTDDGIPQNLDGRYKRIEKGGIDCGSVEGFIITHGFEGFPKRESDHP